jgi:hypothetical protein
MGVGYNIPISISSAKSFTAPQNTDAGTVFLFSSPDSSPNLSASQNATTNNPTTATSSAANGPANAQSQGTGVTAGATGSGSPNPAPTNWLLIGGLALAAFFLPHLLKKL